MIIHQHTDNEILCINRHFKVFQLDFKVYFQW